MRLSPRFLSIAAGGVLLALPSAYSAVAAQASTPEKPATPVAETGAAAGKPVPAPGQTGAAPAQPKPRQEVEAGQDGTLKETPEELRLIELTNQERAKRGLGKLVLDPTLIAVARAHSAEMRDKKYFDHQSPTPGIRTPMDRYLKVVAGAAKDPSFYACVGENLFWSTLVDVYRAHDAFMNSPTHRENVLFPRYEKMAVGIVKNEKGEFWVTEMFLTNSDPKLMAKRMAKGH